MTNQKSKHGAQQPRDASYMVITVSELDQMVYEALLKQKAAKKMSKGETTYVITDKEKARSQVILPEVLNPLGKKGWKLTAINKMECYIFEKVMPRVEVEYKVITPPELDKMALSMLQKEGHLKFSGYDGESPKMELTSSKDTKIQSVLPKVLAEFTGEGWELCAISGPQLYFFTRILN